MNITNNTSNFVQRTETVKAFLAEINKTKVISAQEERELFSQYEDSVNRVKSVKSSNLPIKQKESIISREIKIQDDLRNEIILRNQRFNFAVAKRYDTKNIIMDLVSVGTIGMYEAFEKYDYKEGVRFCSFAVWYIRRAINAYLIKENIPVRNTNNNRILPKVKKIENEFFLKNGRKPSGVEVMDILMERYDIEVAVESDIYGAHMESIDASINDEDSFTFEKTSDFITATATSNDFENEIEVESLSSSTKRALSVLNNREKTIICMSAGYGYDKEYKDKEIADVLGLTSERVRQLRHAASKKFAAAYSAVAK